MDKTKEMELMRRRNSELQAKLDDAEFDLEFLKTMNSRSAEKAKALITELEGIKSEWLAALDDVREKQAEYDCLISDLRKMHEIMREPMKNARRKDRKTLRGFRRGTEGAA